MRTIPVATLIRKLQSIEELNPGAVAVIQDWATQTAREVGMIATAFAGNRAEPGKFTHLDPATIVVSICAVENK